MIYLDTSVIVALLANETNAPAIRQWYAKNDAAQFVTADWSVTEFSTALSLKVRTKQISLKQAKAIQKVFDAFTDGGLRLVAVSRHAFQHGASLIQSINALRAGDALHLAVALEAGVKEFATLDRLLAEKVKQTNLLLAEF